MANVYRQWVTMKSLVQLKGTLPAIAQVLNPERQHDNKQYEKTILCENNDNKIQAFQHSLKVKFTATIFSKIILVPTCTVVP